LDTSGEGWYCFEVRFNGLFNFAGQHHLKEESFYSNLRIAIAGR
jgi:hypothetical protein